MTELISTERAASRAGLPYHVVARWEREGAIDAVLPAEGPGRRTGWSKRQAAALASLARVRADLDALDLAMPMSLVGTLWDQLCANGHAGLHAGSVTISVRLGIEG